MSWTVLGFVEDPGSANFFIGLAGELERSGIHLDLSADGAALPYLQARGERPRSSGGSESELFDRHLLLVGTSENRESSGFALLEAARQRGVKSAAIIDAPSAIAERFKGRSEDAMRYRPDLVVTANEETISELLQMGFAETDVHLIRHPYFDAIERRRAQLAAADRDAKRITLFGPAGHEKIVMVFLCEISDGLRPEEFHRSSAYTLIGSSKSTKRTHVVLDEVIAGLKFLGKEVYVVARLHPKDDQFDYSDYMQRVNCFSVNEDPLEVVYFADLVIGMTTSLLTEAALLGRPVLSVTPRPEEAIWLPRIMRPPIPCVHTTEALRAALDSLLSGPPVIDYKRLDRERSSLSETVATILQNLV